MSYLSDWKNGKLTPLGFFKKSAGWFARQAGADDATIDRVVAETDKATDDAVPQVEMAIRTVILTAFPALPPAAVDVVAHRVAVMAMEQVDVAISAAGAVIKANNGDE